MERGDRAVPAVLPEPPSDPISARLLVEDFLPERIDFTPALPEGAARAGGQLDLSLAAHWLFGALKASAEKRDIKIGRGTHLMHFEAMRGALHRESIAFLTDARAMPAAA